MSKIEILPLFPSTVLKTNINRPLTKKELTFVRGLKTKTQPNFGNITTDDRRILDSSEMTDLKLFFENVIEMYMNSIIQPKYETNAYITQSWLNYTKPGGYHHEHHHPNSFISGVFYVNGDGMNDKIVFTKERHEHFDIQSNVYNLHNAQTWWLPAETGTLILFPSHLTHSVPITKSKKMRVSLAFNTYLKGQLGDPNFANDLIL